MSHKDSLKKMITRVGKVAKTQIPVMFEGEHGLGKSEVVGQIAKEMGLKLISRRASQMTEGDLIGLPKLDGNQTVWLPPDWFKAACNEPCLVFIDEIDRATDSVRQGFFELADSRCIFGHYLHPQTLVFSARNGGKHGKNYKVHQMDMAELSRWFIQPFEPSVEDWLQWASAGNVHKVITDFIIHHQEHLERKVGEAVVPNKVYPCRRSWKRLSDCVSDILSATQKDTEELFFTAKGFVGDEATISLVKYYSNYAVQLNDEDVINNFDKNEARIMVLTNAEHMAIQQQMETNKRFEVKLKPKQIANVVKYMKILPNELFVNMYHTLARQEGEGMKNLKAITESTYSTTETMGEHMAAVVLAANPIS